MINHNIIMKIWIVSVDSFSVNTLLVFTLMSHYSPSLKRLTEQSLRYQNECSETKVQVYLEIHKIDKFSTHCYRLI